MGTHVDAGVASQGGVPHLLAAANVRYYRETIDKKNVTQTVSTAYVSAISRRQALSSIANAHKIAHYYMLQ